MYLFGMHVTLEKLWQLGSTLVAAAVISATVFLFSRPAIIITSCVVGAGWIVAMVLLSKRSRRNREQAEIAALRAGKPAFYQTNDLIEYGTTVSSLSGDTSIDRETILDLDIPELHEAANATLTLTGELSLFSMLTTPQKDDSKPALRNTIIERMTRDDMHEICQALHRIGRDRHADVFQLLFGHKATKDPRYPYYIVQCVVTVILIIVVIAGVSQAILPMALMLALNGFTNFRSAVAFTDLLPKFTTLVRIVDTADTFSNDPELKSLSEWKNSRAYADVRKLTRAVWFLAILPGQAGDLLEMLLLLPRAFLLLDALVYNRIAKLVLACREKLIAAYTIVGEVDALQALSLYRDSLPESCSPEVTNGHTGICARRAYHPLIENAVSNDIDIKAPGWVLTGANMSGKSTFLRTVLINVLLSRTVGFCCAGTFLSGRYRIASLIRKTDSVTEGSSFYFYEAHRIYEMIQSVDGGDPLLLAVDEFFAGTNSKERIAAAVAVLKFLEQIGCMTIAATHDQEVALNLEGSYYLCHFADRIEDDQIRFDYKLKSGIIRSTNGLRLLRSIGYPEQILSYAENIEPKSQ